MRYLFSFLIGLSAINVHGLTAVENAHKNPIIRQPVDQTDIFAIPLDEDEDEQDAELNALEHPKK
ncbi:MAG: hypothetical protein ACSNEK_04600 [Parachlamydiaceae bacterium]